MPTNPFDIFIQEQEEEKKDTSPIGYGASKLEELVNLGLKPKEAVYAVSRLNTAKNNSDVDKIMKELQQEFQIGAENTMEPTIDPIFSAAMGFTAAPSATGGGIVKNLLGRVTTNIGKRAATAAGWTAADFPVSMVEETLEQKGHPVAATAAGFAMYPLLFSLPTLAKKLRPNVLKDLIKGGEATISGLSTKAGSAAQSTEQARKLFGSLPFVKSGSKIAKGLGGTSLEELFISPLERMPTEAAKAMYGTTVETQRIGRAWSDIAKSVSEMPLEKRELFRNFLKSGMNFRTVPTELRAEFGRAIAPYQQTVKEFTKQQIFPSKNQQKLYQSELSKGLNRLFGESINDPVYQGLRETTKHDLSTLKGGEAFLKDVLDSELIPYQTKRLAADLYNLPAMTASEVVTKNKSSFESILFSRLKNMPNVVSPIPQEGFIPSTHKRFKGLYVEKNTEQGLHDLDDIRGQVAKNWEKYFLIPWKISKVHVRPVAWIRDVVSNMIFNDIGGAYPLSPTNVKLYTEAAKDLRNRTKVAKQFEKLTGASLGSWSDVEIKSVLNASKYNSNMFDTMLKFVADNPLTKTASNIRGFSDAWTKLAKFKWNLQNGMPEYDAAMDAVRTVGDHMRQTKFTRMVRNTAMPFFGWQVHAIRTFGQGVKNHPIRTAKYLAIPMALGAASLEKLNISRDEWEEIKRTLPEYLSKDVAGIPTHIPMPWRDDKGRIQLVDMSWWIPGFQDIAETGASAQDPMRFLQNPAFTIAAGLKTNKKFTGEPIWYEWESPEVKTSKVFNYLWQQIMPTILPGGTDFEKLSSAFEESGEKTLTPSQAIGWQFGYRVTPIDPNRQREKFINMRKYWITEANGQMRRELEKYRDNPKKQEQITNKYTKMIQDIQQEMTGENNEE